jgi:hypothetical protein
MRKKTTMAVVLALLAAVGVFASTASAGSGGARVPPGSIWADIPAAMACPGATSGVTITYVSGNYSETFPAYGIFVTGNATFEVTNNATGKSVLVPTDGRGKVTWIDTGSVFADAGRTLWYFFPGDVGPGDQTTARMYLIDGNTTAVDDPNFATLAFSYQGRIVEDVCAAIS